MGAATKVKIRLAERFGAWPLLTPAHAMTAAQAILLAEALAPEKAERPPAAPAAKGKRKPAARQTAAMPPRVSRKVLEELARRDDPDVLIER